MKYVVIAIFILSVFFASQVSAQFVEGADYLNESVATVDRCLSGLVNPAGLAQWSSMGLLYAHTFTDSSYKGDDGAMISSKGTFFGVEWLNHTSGLFRRKYTLAMGDKVFPNLYIGLSYSWFSSGSAIYHKVRDWKIGVIYRPHPAVSMGLVADRINEPKFSVFKQKRLYTPGLAIRPFGDKFTMSSDARWLEGDELTKLKSNVRLTAGSFHGVSFLGEYRSEGEWRLGMTFDFQTTRVGSQGKLRNEKDWAGGTYSMEVGMVRFGETVPVENRRGMLTLNDKITEETRKSSIFGGNQRSFFSVIDALHKGADDPRIKELIVRFDGIKMDFASAQELRSAISTFRANNKKVTAFMSVAGNLDYYVASAADEIYMDPTGLLELKGLAINARFYKGTMDKLGIHAQFVHTGPHKTYGDAYSETTLTDAAREQIDWLLDDLYSQFVDGISTGRHILPEKVKAFIDDGPYSSQRAYKVGLVDGLKHFDEIVEDNPVKAFMSQVDLVSFYTIKDYNPRWSEPKKIAVVYANGSIVQGQNGSSLIDGKTVGDETLARTLKKLRYDNTIKAIVLRVNSPGGDVFASENIYRQLELLKGKKPLVVSMGGVAASGGYYISCPGDEIMASPGTITGSIGVVMGKMDLSQLYSKIGINNETVKRGQRADIRSTNRPATDDEMSLIDTMLWEFYDDFLNKVGTWRKLDVDSIDAIGQGRVWTGRQALQRGLVDTYGGLWEAVEQARQKAKIDPDDELQIESYPIYPMSFLPSFGVPSLESQISELINESTRDGIYYKSPFELEFK
jgi:protease IV